MAAVPPPACLLLLLAAAIAMHGWALLLLGRAWLAALRWAPARLLCTGWGCRPAGADASWRG
jgi:hypothetical protein